MKINARFWVWWNCGWVKLTLRPGQEVHLAHGRLTDEGFACEAQSFALDEHGNVISEIRTWGRDCDGGHEWNAEHYCPVQAMHDREDHETGEPICPPWAKLSSGQRDEYAEMAGY